MLELLEASGAREPRVLALPAPGEVAPAAERLLYGKAGVGAAAFAEELRGTSHASATREGATQVWAFDVARLLDRVEERLVESVETLIRIVTPEALGANATPPPADVALRIA